MVWLREGVNEAKPTIFHVLGTLSECGYQILWYYLIQTGYFPNKYQLTLVESY